MAMKVMLSNGWYQEVAINNEGEQVVRYMKNGEEFSKKQWEESKRTNNSIVKKPFISNLRKKVANIISPNESSEYSYIPEIKLASPETENQKALKRAHEDFEQSHNRPAIDDAEAWKWDREQLNVILKELGHDPVSTVFVPEYFTEK